jgi:hypothetical protein
MKYSLVIILGAALSLFGQLSLPIMLAVGFLAGGAGQTAEVFFPRPRQPYIPPQNRPKSATRSAQLVAVIFLALLGLVLIALAYLVRLPRPWMQLNGAFLGAACLGAASALLAMGTKTRESHNAWLAAMTPQKPLDFES